MNNQTNTPEYIKQRKMFLEVLNKINPIFHVDGERYYFLQCIEKKGIVAAKLSEGDQSTLGVCFLGMPLPGFSVYAGSKKLTFGEIKSDQYKSLLS